MSEHLISAQPTFSRQVIDSSFAGDVKGIGDIDGDGFADLVIGGFQMYVYRYPSWTKQLVATANIEFTTDMKLTDVDGDGDLDIVTADGSTGNNVIWLENPRPSSSSSWARHVIGPHSSWTHDIEVGDLDRDGRIDVVTRGLNQSNLFFQNSPTSWTRRDVSSILGSGEGLGLGDVNGDGFLDLAAAGRWIRSPSNPRTGTWVSHSIASVSSETTAVIADINNDGRADVVFANQHARDTLAWYEAPSDPINGTWIRHVIDASMGSHKLNVGDINKDGRLDVVAGLELAQLSVYLSTGDSGFTFTKQTLSTNGTHNQQLADIGNDGDLDIFGANYLNNPPVELWENTTPATALPLNRWTYKAVSTAHQLTFGLAFGDLNADGRKDIASGAYWYRNPGGNLLGTWTQSALPSGMHAILATNVDGDGFADVIAQRGESSLALYWLEASDASASAWTSVRIGGVPAASHTEGAQGYRLAQIEAGGLPEVLISSGNGIYYFRIPASPSSGSWPMVHVNANPSDEGFAVGDIDRDGRLDLAATTGNSKRVEWYRNPGTGAGGWQAFPLGSVTEMLFPDRTELGDFDKDGRLDVAVSEENGLASDARTYWWRQPATATTSNWARQLITTQGTTNSMDAADMDDDGDVDLILAEHRGSLTLSVWASSGTGTFARTVVSTGRESHLGARASDLDNDGDLDIVSIAYDAPQNLHLWRNDALGGSTGDTTPPSVSITAPSNGSSVTGTVTVAATASDAGGIAGVQFRVDGANLGSEDAAAPYSVAWNTATATPGAHTLSAVARDAAGNLATATITVTVAAPTDTTPPTVSITAPGNGSSVSGTVTIAASAADAGGIAGVQFRVDGTNVGSEDVTAPYSVAWNTTTAAAGNHTLSAVARDIAGNLAITTITVTVVAGTDTTPPTVSITAPTAGSSVSGTVTVSASAADAGGIAGVQFKVDGANLGSEDVTAPYSVAWNAAAATPGSHTLSAVARDAAGNLATATVTVTVASTPGGGDISTGLVSHWTLDDGSGTTAQDSTGGHTGTLGNGPSWVAGRMGHALSFDGTDDLVSLGSFDVSGTALTIAAWIKPDSFLIDDARILAKASGSAEQDHYFMLSTVSNGGMKLRFRLKTGTTTSTLLAPSGPLTAGQWMHVAAVYDGSAMILYKDAVEVGRLTKTGSVATNSSVPVAIGRNPQPYAPFDGAIDDVRIYQRALAPNAISTLAGLTSPPADTTPPVVSITAPSNGSTVSGTVTVSASATDAGGVAGVQFRVDGTNIGAEDLTAPYSIAWNTASLAAGSHTLSAVARDAAGNSATTSVTVTVAPPADTTAPTVSITAPSPGSTVSGTTTVSANATDSVGVAGVQFRVDGTNIGAEDLTAPYSVAWNTTTATAGSHTLSAVARDAAGNVATSSVMVTVATPADTTPPTVSITAPSNGSSVSGTVTVAANAADAGGLAGVQFKVNGTNLGAEDLTAPYSASWNTTTATPGTHTVSAVARDTAGNLATATVTVTVSSASGGDVTTGLVGHWLLDDGSGTTARDSVGSYSGTLGGPSWVPGKLGQALSFDGVDDYVGLGAFDVSGSALTIAAWIKADNFATDDARVLSKTVGPAEQDHYFMLSTVNNGGIKLRFRLKTGTTTSTLLASSGPLTAGQWMHVAAVYNGSAMILYKDGVEVGRLAKTGAMATNASVPVAIGRNAQPYGAFDGTIDDVRVYRRALAASDVQALAGAN